MAGGGGLAVESRAGVGLCEEDLLGCAGEQGVGVCLQGERRLVFLGAETPTKSMKRTKHRLRLILSSYPSLKMEVTVFRAICGRAVQR